MTFRFQYALGAIALAAALGLTIPKANADQVYRGTFHLPFQTYWGGSVLEPGDYTVSMEGATERLSVIHVQGEKGVATILTGPVEVRDGVGKGRLVLANVNGLYAIRELDAGAIGKSFSFALPKNFRGVSQRGGASETSIVTMH
jgi:hypothetical protein